MKQIYKILGIIGLFALLWILVFGDRINLEWYYKSYIESVAISSDGKYIVAGGQQDTNGNGRLDTGYICFFDKNGSLLWIYKTGDYFVNSVAISSDGKYIVAGSSRGYVYFFDKDGNLLWKHKTKGCVNSVSITPSGEYVVVGSGNKVYFFDKNGSLLWKYGTKGCVIRNESIGSPVNTPKALIGIDWNSEIRSVAITPDGKYVVAGSDGNYIVVGSEGHYDMNRHGYVYFFDKNGNLLWKHTTGHCVYSVAISSDGNYVVARGWGNVCFFDKSGNLLWKYKTGWVESVAISSDGKYVIVGSWEDTDNDRFLDLGYVCFFDKNGNLLWKYKTGNYFVSSVAITPDGNYIVAGGWKDIDRDAYPDKGNVYLFDKNGNLLWKYKTMYIYLYILATYIIKYLIPRACPR
jgi:outer membrane protein assembly factor BamB